MSAYLVLVLFVFLFALCYIDKINGRSKTKKNIFIFTIIILIIISSLKNEKTSSDASNYITLYGEIPSISQLIGGFSYALYTVEPGYVILNAICKEFTNSPFLIFTVISIISLGFYGFIIWEYSPLPFLSIFIYYCWFYFIREMVIIRYGVASAVLLLSLIRLSEQRVIKSIFWAVIASLFHYTALTYIFVLGIWLFFSKSRKIVLAETLIIVSFPFAILGVTLIKVAEFVYSMHILPPFFQTALYHGVRYISLQKGQSRGIQVLLVYLPIFFLYKKCKKDDILKGFYFIFLLAFFMTFEFLDVVEFARIPMMYMTVMTLFLPMIITKINKNGASVAYSYTLIVVIYYFIAISLSQEMIRF